jgi:hypothetical protein
VAGSQLREGRVDDVDTGPFPDEPDWDTAARDPRRGMAAVLLAVAAIVGVAVLAGGGASIDASRAEGEVAIERATTPLEPAQAPGVPPLDAPTPAAVEGTYQCLPPFTIAAYTIDGRRLAYPPGHPARPDARVAPDLCSDDMEALAEAGYAIPDPPRGYAFVDGIYLREIADALRGDCESAAAALEHQIPCPTVVPADRSGDPPMCTDLPPGGNHCVVGAVGAERAEQGFLIRVGDIPLLPTRSGDASPGDRDVGGFSLAATTPDGGYEPLVLCDRDDEPVVTPRRRSVVTSCGWAPSWNGEGGFPHQGLVTERWRHEDVYVAVSLGDETMNLDEARRRIVEGLYWVGPAQPPRTAAARASSYTATK